MDTKQSSNSSQLNLTIEKMYSFPKMPKNNRERDIGCVRCHAIKIKIKNQAMDKVKRL